MKNISALLLIIAFPLTIACQKAEDTGSTDDTSAGKIDSPQLVKAANGRLLSVPCLTERAADIAKASNTSLDEAESLAQKCDVDALVATANSSRGTHHKDWDRYRYYIPYGYSYAPYYNPSSYCNGGYYNPGFFSAVYGGAFNYGGYGNGWQLRSLGYPYYGYGSYGYNGYGITQGDPCTTSCLKVTASNAAQCAKACWGSQKLE